MMTNKNKKVIKAQLIKLGKTNKKDRAQFWAYILYNDLSVGYAYAQELERKGVQVLKIRTYDPKRPD